MQLLEIEARILSLDAVQSGLNIAEIRRSQKQIANAQKNKFNHTIALSKVVVRSFGWFNSEAGKAIFREEGVTWTAEDFASKVFGWQKSYFYKVIKAGKLPEEKIEQFSQLCADAERQGISADRSLSGLLAWARNNEAEQTDDVENNDADDVENGQVESVARVENVLTISFKAKMLGESRNISIRVDADGNVITQNTSEEITLLVNFLGAAIQNRNNQ